MKETLHQWMFESGSYKLLPEHVALYEALEVSMEQENRDEFLAEKDKSRKRHHDDQDPPPLPDSDLSKKKEQTLDFQVVDLLQQGETETQIFDGGCVFFPNDR
nr:hypothetical protein [Tanacetum cinerariifolium]